MKNTKKIIFIAVSSTILFACKKSNEEKIIGKWVFSSLQNPIEAMQKEYKDFNYEIQNDTILENDTLLYDIDGLSEQNLVDYIANYNNSQKTFMLNFTANKEFEVYKEGMDNPLFATYTLNKDSIELKYKEHIDQEASRETLFYSLTDTSLIAKFGEKILLFKRKN